MNNYPTFESWFHELENYATRAERCYDDYDLNHHLGKYKNFRKWLEAAFYAARLQQSYVLTVQEQDGEQYLEFPEEVLKSQGWEIGTKLEWLDNGDGSWTLRAKQ